MSRLKRCLIITASVAALGILFLFPAYAANYKVYNVEWVSDDNGLATVTWDHSTEKADRTAWKVRLYRGSEGKTMTKWITTQEDHIDFSLLISRSGTGRYYVEVYSEKGGEETTAKSDYYVVDGEELDNIKKWVKKKQQEAVENSTVYGWISGPDGTWKYHFTNGIYATGWQQIDGQTYYFSTNYLMLTGWQVINNRWYYFDTKSGALLRNSVSPDGYTVNADGMLCVDGAPVDASFQPKNNEKNAQKTLTNLTKIKLNSKETKMPPNVVRPMVVTSDGKFSVETYEFSQPYEQWQAGVPITVTCTICANTGYCFTDSTQVTFNRGKLMSFTGNSVERVVVYTYYPRLVLESPTNVFLSEDETLTWSPVPNAVRYILKISQEGERLTDIYLTTTSVDFSEYASQDYISFTITAIARESVRNYYYDSFETKVDNIGNIRVNGTITQQTGSMVYRDSFGAVVNGWVELGGNWFHFTDGRTERPGWWQDNNGCWYYFDNNFHMMTGEIVDNGEIYFLNDGTYTNLPLGALVE